MSLRIMVMSPRAQVVTRGLFLMVVSSQDMMRVAGDGDKQLVICGSSQGHNCREVVGKSYTNFSNTIASSEIAFKIIMWHGMSLWLRPTPHWGTHNAHPDHL